MKQAVLNLMWMSGAFEALRLLNRSKVLVLTYHRFSEAPYPERISASALASQLDYLRSRYTIVSLSMIERWLHGNATLPAASAAITIDDGYRDAYEIALPIFRERNVPATLFAVTDFIDGKSWLWTDAVHFITARAPARQISVPVGGGTLELALNGRESRAAAAVRINEALKEQNEATRKETIERIALECGTRVPDLPPPEFGPASWDQLREMEASGIAIGSHTVSHPILTQVDAAQLNDEVTRSRARLEAMLDHPVTLFCYPNGTHSARVRDAVARVGYRLAVTTEPGLNDGTTDPLALRRVHTEWDLPHFAQSTSGFEETKARLRAYI